MMLKIVYKIASCQINKGPQPRLYAEVHIISHELVAQRILEQKWVGERRIRCHTTQSILHPYIPIALSFLYSTHAGTPTRHT